MSNYEQIDDEFDEDELNKILEEIDRDHKKIDQLVYSLNLLYRLHNICEDFIEKLTEIENLLPSLDDKSSGLFLRGSIFGNIFSLYEGTIHDLLEALLSDPLFSSTALDRIVKIDPELRDKLRLKSNSSDFKEKIGRSTLNDPAYGAKILRQVFDIDIIIDDQEFAEALEIRNAYTHNNGKKNGIKLNVTQKMIDNLLYDIDRVIGVFAENIKNKVNLS